MYPITNWVHRAGVNQGAEGLIKRKHFGLHYGKCRIQCFTGSKSQDISSSVPTYSETLNHWNIPLTQI